MGLKTVETLSLPTIQGPCTIELLLGDITSLEMKDKVDLLIVSAFPNNYSAASKTLIHALDKNLNVDVSRLAADKELDLRKYFSCWLSKPLPEDMPFSRLACFERNLGSSIHDQIGDMFRGFMPIFNSQDTTVITPLLGTGNQGFGYIPVLNTMVESACNWMKIGLPLKCLKIVLHTSDINEISNSNKKCLERFKVLKKTWEKSTLSKISKKNHGNDVYISYCNTDSKKANLLKASLEKNNPNISIFNKRIKVDQDVWPEKVYSCMFGCKCIVIILTTSYLSSKFCQDEFNMALCYRRQAEDVILVPLYTETMENLPPVISNIQYMDCRLNENENIKEKFKSVSVDINKKLLPPLLSPTTAQAQTSKKTTYDIFVSYPTKNTEEMKIVYEILTEHNSDLKIFYDKMELETGSDWQQSIYKALECSKCCVILIAPAYFESLMCQEEFSIAIALSISEESTNPMVLVPVCIADVPSTPQWFGPLHMIDARGDCLVPVLSCLSPLLNKCYKNQTLQHEFSWMMSKSKLNNENISLLDQLSLLRQIQLEDNYELKGKKITAKVNYDIYKNPCKILFCFAPQDMKFAAILISILQDLFSEMQVLLFSTSIHDRLALLEEADVIVMFVCDDYFESSKSLEELNIAFNRQRKSKQKLLHFVCTEKIPTFLTYFQILPYNVVFSDSCWQTKRGKFVNTKGMVTVTVSEICGKYSYEIPEYMALQKLALDIISSVSTDSSDNKENLVNLFNIRPEETQVLSLEECIVTWQKEKSDDGNKSSTTTMDDMALKISVDDEDTENILNEEARNELSAENLPNENENENNELNDGIIPETESIPVQDVKSSKDVNFTFPHSDDNKINIQCTNTKQL
eukprot:XP_014768475.1 PREDICTED: uncharacterized protein LOC106867918 [Octopus bimaculoides]